MPDLRWHGSLLDAAGIAGACRLRADLFAGVPVFGGSGRWTGARNGD